MLTKNAHYPVCEECNGEGAFGVKVRCCGYRMYDPVVGSVCCGDPDTTFESLCPVCKGEGRLVPDTAK